VTLDIITFTSTLSTVDARRILLWGMSFGGMVSGICSTLDRRVKGLAMICPLFSFVADQKRKNVLAQCIKDRTSQLRGNEAFTLQPFNSRGENPAGMGGSGGPGGIEAYNLMQAAADLRHPGFRNRIALQTYLKLVLARPKEVVGLLEDVPVFMIIPELDDISAPAEQQEVFDKLNVKKRLCLAKGKGHLSIMTGEGSVELIEATKLFFGDALEGKLV
jgi:pimeloyl-ACP methyl ester carboxylesterase